MRVRQIPLLATGFAVAAALGLGACDQRQPDRTVGQKVDTAIAQVEKKSDQAAAEIKKDVEAAGTSTRQAVDSAGSKVKDAAITTGINAELTRDASLSALKIDVDTSEGRVALRGSAPDAAARERATKLAQRVDGVVSVDNQLQLAK
jgi:hyperosmotically inducible periplasmic protein